MKVVKGIYAVAVVVLMVVGLSGAPAHAVGDCAKGPGGGEFPVPFGNANQRAELADGEYYVLSGKLVERGDYPYFVPDFGKHAWLAGAKRKGEPFYPIELGSEVPRELIGKEVRIAAHAVGRVHFDENQTASWVIYLRPIEKNGLVSILSPSCRK